MTNLLAQELGKSNPLVKLNTSDVEIIKEQYSCCADDDFAYQKTQKSCQEEHHTLPDGQVCNLVFQPDNTPHDALSTLLKETIQEVLLKGFLVLHFNAYLLYVAFTRLDTCFLTAV